jgi:hypothetical protein
MENFTPQQLMALLEDDASYLRPTLFAVYGVTEEGRPFLGWGMQFDENEAISIGPAPVKSLSRPPVSRSCSVMNAVGPRV